MTRQQFIKYLLKYGIVQFYIMDDGPLKGMVMVSSDYFLEKMTSVSLQMSISSDSIDLVDIISLSIDDNIKKGNISLSFDIRNTEPEAYEPYCIYDKKRRCYVKDQDGDVETFIDDKDAYDYLLKDSVFKKYKNEVDIKTKVRKEHDDYFIDITEETKEIFGDDVKRVEVSFLHDYYNLSEDELQEGILIRACEVLVDLFLRPSYVDFGGETLYITFHSGNQVEITNSEWTDLSKA